MFSLSFEKRLRKLTMAVNRQALGGVNLLSRREVNALFENRDTYIERVALLSKSYTVRRAASNTLLTQTSCAACV